MFVAAGRAARRTSVSWREARWFHAVNRLPSAAYPVVWPVMQAGSLGGVVAAAAGAAAVQRPTLATRLLVAGTAAWLGAKGIKHLVRRGRPGTTLPEWRTRGRPQTGLGYPSGHAAVAATLATIAAPSVPPRWRPVLWTAAATTALGRVYVGAHLPLDVVGGAALGHAVGSVALVVGRR